MNAYPELSLFIAGEFLPAAGRETQPVINPSTGEILGRLPHASKADLDRALESAQQSFETWRKTSPVERSNILRKAAGLIRERKEHIAKLLTLEEAIRKMTSQPAARVGLLDRGILRPGMAADVTIFDPATIRDVATFADPNHYAVGVKHVFVNGQAVVKDGAITDARPGRPLRGPGYRAKTP